MRRVLAVIAASTLVLAACGDDDDDDAASATTAAAGATDASLPVPQDQVVGATVDDATAALQAEGWELRVVERDGQPLPATADYVPNRVNVAVETKDGTETVTSVVSVG